MLILFYIYYLYFIYHIYIYRVNWKLVSLVEQMDKQSLLYTKIYLSLSINRK